MACLPTDRQTDSASLPFSFIDFFNLTYEVMCFTVISPHMYHYTSFFFIPFPTHSWLVPPGLPCYLHFISLPYSYLPPSLTVLFPHLHFSYMCIQIEI